jgi:hypothetical protein
MWATSVIFKNLPKVNIHPIGENSPILVTLDSKENNRIARDPNWNGCFVRRSGRPDEACEKNAQNVARPIFIEMNMPFFTWEKSTPTFGVISVLLKQAHWPITQM